MKKHFLVFVCVVVLLLALSADACADGPLNIDVTNFPDAAFRQYVADTFDGDKNGKLSAEEIAAAEIIDLANTDCVANTTTLQGIGVFTNLRELKAPFMKKLDGVLSLASNTALEVIQLPNAQAEASLDGVILGNQPNLDSILITNNWELTSLDFSGCPALNSINVDGAALTSLDVSACSNLYSLSCAFTKLTELDLSQNQKLELLGIHHNAKLGALSLAGLSKLRALSVQYTPISVLDISECPDLLALLGHPEYYSDKGDSHLFAAGPNHDDDHLWFSKTTTLLIGGEIAVNEITFPDAAFRQYVADTFDGDKNGKLSAEEIAAAEIIDLTNTDCVANTTTLQGIGVFTNLRELKAPNMKKLDGVLSLANNTLLESIGMRTTMPDAEASESLDGLILGNLPNLSRLVVTNRWDLTALDLSGCPALLEANLDGCKLSALDLSHNKNLLSLTCAFTNLADIDLSQNRQLMALSFHHCENMTSLSLAGLSNLHQLTVQYTPIPVLDISGCPYLLALLENEACHTDLGDRHLYETNNSNMADRLFFSKTTLLKTEASQVFTTLTLPAALTRIDAEAFAGIAADVVVLPQGCEYVGSGAFTDCPKLKVIYAPETAVFEGDAVGENVYVARTAA